MVSYILDIKWLRGCSEVGDHKRESRKSPHFFCQIEDWWWELIWLMIDHCYVINESFIHPYDKWMVCSYNHVHIFIIFMYKLPQKFPNKLKALEIRKYHGNLKLIELLPSVSYPSRNKYFVSTSKHLLKNGNWTFPIVLFHMKTFVSETVFCS